ncbi:MAG: hypothetical protein ACKVJ6_04190 [Flavobacteriales bacterium]
MFNRIIFISLLIICTSCSEDVSSDSRNSDIIQMDVFKDVNDVSPPFGLDFSLVQTSPSNPTLSIVLTLDTGDYVISPTTPQDFMGVFNLSFRDSSGVEVLRGIQAFPTPIDKVYPFDDNPIKCFVGTTLISHKLKIEKEGDFEAYGTVFFVHEPSCYPYEVSFLLSRQLGNLSIEKLQTIIPEIN